MSTNLSASLPVGTVYSHNPYFQGTASPFTIISAPAPKQSPASPIAPGLEEDEQGLTPNCLSLNGSDSFGSRSPLSSGRVTPRSQQSHHQSYHQSYSPVVHHQHPSPVTRSPSEGAVAGNYHRALAQHPVRYLPYTDLGNPQLMPPPSSGASSIRGPKVRLFVGQVLHEFGAFELSTLVAQLALTPCVKAVPHGPGCFFVELPALHYHAVRQLNNKVLFDVHGLWFAESPVEAKAMQSYLASVKASMKNDPTMRLPRSALVVRR